MKISMVITEGAKQIMMTPETDHEREALRYIGIDDELKVVKKWGIFGNDYDHVNYQVSKCQGGYYRPFETKESLMFVIEDESNQE